jgi:signal transduction histidine kinase
LIDRATIKGLTFQQEIESKLPSVVGNEETLVMVIINLIENAIKFTPSGSVNLSIRRNSDRVSIIVSDDGIGIPEEAIPNLYQRFYRARTAVERGIAGSGLGLYMVKEGLERFGGSILTESAEGAGTTIKVSLPIAPE